MKIDNDVHYPRENMYIMKFIIHIHIAHTTKYVRIDFLFRKSRLFVHEYVHTQILGVSR